MQRGSRQMSPDSETPDSAQTGSKGGSLVNIFWPLWILGSVVWWWLLDSRWGASLDLFSYLGFAGAGSVVILFVSLVLAIVLDMSFGGRRTRSSLEEAEPSSTSDTEATYKTIVFVRTLLIGSLPMGIVGLVLVLLGVPLLPLGIVLAILAIPAWVVFPKAFANAAVEVPQQEAWVVFRLGKFKRALEPGTRQPLPWYDAVVKKINLRWDRIPVVANQTITVDKVVVNVPGTLWWRPLPSEPAKHFLAVQNIEQNLQAAAEVAFREIASLCSIEDLQKLSTIPERVKELHSILQRQVIDWYVETRLELSDVILSPELERVFAQLKEAKILAEAKQIHADAEAQVLETLWNAAKARRPEATDQEIWDSVEYLRSLETVRAAASGGTIQVLPLGDLLSRRQVGGE
ncbi:MAG: SPFH domain-containing protein [Patescibacteria group bacterium]